MVSLFLTAEFSEGGSPAIDCQYLARNVAACSACEKDGGSLEVIGTTPSASRDTFEDTGGTLLVIDQGVIHVRVDVSRSDLFVRVSHRGT
jgi:hypothetical protein